MISLDKFTRNGLSLNKTEKIDECGQSNWFAHKAYLRWAYVWDPIFTKPIIFLLQVKHLETKLYIHSCWHIWTLQTDNKIQFLHSTLYPIPYHGLADSYYLVISVTTITNYLIVRIHINYIVGSYDSNNL